MWKVLGCGGFYLGAWQAGLESFARDGEHGVWYRGHDEAVELARRHLAEPGLRAQIAAAGRAHALQHHTYRHRLELLLAGRSYPLSLPHISV
jgi:spore maturation protein CgeB